MKGDGAAPGLGPNVKHPLAGPFLSVVSDITTMIGLGPNVNTHIWRVLMFSSWISKVPSRSFWQPSWWLWILDWGKPPRKVFKAQVQTFASRFQAAAELVVASFSCAELGTAQPQLVSIVFQQPSLISQ